MVSSAACALLLRASNVCRWTNRAWPCRKGKGKTLHCSAPLLHEGMQCQRRVLGGGGEEEPGPPESNNTKPREVAAAATAAASFSAPQSAKQLWGGGGQKFLQTGPNAVDSWIEAMSRQQTWRLAVEERAGDRPS